MHAKQVESFFEFRLITSAPLMLLIITGSLGRLTYVPKNNFVLKGTTVEFTCCSDEQEPLFWKVRYISSPSMRDIYDAGLVNGFRNNGRFNVTGGSRSGCYRLIIKDIEVDDAGTYFCVDHQGLGQQKEWELVIVEYLDCQDKNRKAEYMGENKFGLPEDVFSTVCVSKYFGNIPPKLICRWSSGTHIFDNHQHFTETNLTTTLSIQMPARKAFNGDQLSCYLKIDGTASDNQATTAWKSPQLIINYASFHERGVSQCSVDELQLDCQPRCNYKSVGFSNGSSYCEITYPNKTHQTFFVSLQDTSNSTTNLPDENQAHLKVILLAVAFVQVIIFGTVGVTAAIFERKRRQRQQMAKPEEIPFVPDSNRGRHTISRPGTVINMGDGNTVTINAVCGEQQVSVTTQPENAPRFKASSIMDLSRTPATPFSDPDNVSVIGIAILGRHLFVAYRGSSRVMVYSAKRPTLGYKTSWELANLTRPQDVTACNKNNCLYISNIKPTDSECEILKVSAVGNLIKQWQTGRNYFGRLSVTHDFNVLLAVYSTRRLVEYNPDGNRLKEIQLPGALYPNCALKDNSGYYFVSHGSCEDHVHGVSQVDASGEVLKRFGNNKGSTNDQLNTPVNLVMNDGSILVADSNNGRVVALSSSLKYKATLLSKEEDDLGRPLRMCLDKVNHRLLLCDFQNESHFLRVFNFV